MMLVLSPVIGWGIAGFGAEAQLLAEEHPLFLAPGPRYAMATLVLHMVYGAIVGSMDDKLIRWPAREPTLDVEHGRA
jgi:tetrahydromethanopterin S-methyltransferase subunit C